MSHTGEDQQIRVTPHDEEAKAAANSPRRDDADKLSQTSDERRQEAATKPTTVRIAKESSLRRLITYVIARIQGGSTVTLQALTL